MRLSLLFFFPFWVSLALLLHPLVLLQRKHSDDRKSSNKNSIRENHGINAALWNWPNDTKIQEATSQTKLKNYHLCRWELCVMKADSKDLCSFHRFLWITLCFSGFFILRGLLSYKLKNIFIVLKLCCTGERAGNWYYRYGYYWG